MSASEDEQQSLDAGWDDETSSPNDDEDDVDQAWDSLPPPVSGAPASASSMPPLTEAVDSGWDDVPEGGTLPNGKRRPHRPRRAKSGVASVTSSPVLLPRPAEPTKKQQREHARKQRAYEAQVKQQRKQERKAQRQSDMRQDVEARRQQAEAEALERQKRRAERERIERERPKPVARVAVPKPARSEAPKREPLESSGSSVRTSERPASPAKAPAGRLRPGVLLTLAVLVALALLLLWRK